MHNFERVEGEASQQDSVRESALRCVGIEDVWHGLGFLDSLRICSRGCCSNVLRFGAKVSSEHSAVKAERRTWVRMTRVTRSIDSY